MSIMKLSNVSKSYGSKAVLENFNMEIFPGEFVAITGTSGSGKSTLLNILGLLEPIDSGTYRILDTENPRSDSKESVQLLRNKISYLFQNFALVNERSVSYNLEIALRFVRVSKARKKELIHRALHQVGLAGFENKKVFELSGGEQQRVALARIILKPSEIILADEPTGSLDLGNRDNVMQILAQLNQEGKTVIVVTHDPNVEKCAKRVIRLGA